MHLNNNPHIILYTTSLIYMYSCIIILYTYILYSGYKYIYINMYTIGIVEGLLHNDLNPKNRVSAMCPDKPLLYVPVYLFLCIVYVCLYAYVYLYVFAYMHAYFYSYVTLNGHNSLFHSPITLYIYPPCFTIHIIYL